jgi:hypothetical protein
MMTEPGTPARRCPLCRHEEPAPPVPPRLREMTLGDAWGVTKDAATRCLLLSFTTGIVFGALYFWRGTFEPVEMPPWATFMIWAGFATVGYFSIADLAVLVGGWLARTGDFWKQASHIRRVVDVGLLALTILGFIYQPLATWIILIPVASVLTAFEDWQAHKLAEAEEAKRDEELDD